MRRCLREPPLPAQSIRPDLPEDVLAVIHQLMDKDLDRRTPTAAAAIEVLKPLVGDGARAAVARSVEHYQEVMRARRAHHSPSRQPPREEINETLSDSAAQLSPQELDEDSSGAAEHRCRHPLGERDRPEQRALHHRLCPCGARAPGGPGDAAGLRGVGRRHRGAASDLGLGCGGGLGLRAGVATQTPYTRFDATLPAPAPSNLPLTSPAARWDYPAPSINLLAWRSRLF